MGVSSSSTSEVEGSLVRTTLGCAVLARACSEGSTNGNTGSEGKDEKRKDYGKTGIMYYWVRVYYYILLLYVAYMCTNFIWLPKHIVPGFYIDYWFILSIIIYTVGVH